MLNLSTLNREDIYYYHNSTVNGTSMSLIFWNSDASCSGLCLDEFLRYRGSHCCRDVGRACFFKLSLFLKISCMWSRSKFGQSILNMVMGFSDQSISTIRIYRDTRDVEACLTFLAHWLHQMNSCRLQDCCYLPLGSLRLCWKAQQVLLRRGVDRSPKAREHRDDGRQRAEKEAQRSPNTTQPRATEWRSYH